MVEAKPTNIVHDARGAADLVDPSTSEGLCVMGPQRKSTGSLTTTPSARCRAASSQSRAIQQSDRQAEIDHMTFEIL